ncbi:hypothetical protein PFISCL1PPCAC_17738, partial [Pristionchus fissidentatus]
NSMFNEIAFNVTKATNPWLILGMVCNSSTRRLEWMDGSKITNTKKNFNVNFDCVSTTNLVDSEPHNDQWYSFSSSHSDYWTVLCVAEPNNCGEYDALADPADETKPCFKV